MVNRTAVSAQSGTLLILTAWGNSPIPLLCLSPAPVVGALWPPVCLYRRCGLCTAVLRANKQVQREATPGLLILRMPIDTTGTRMQS